MTIFRWGFRLFFWPFALFAMLTLAVLLGLAWRWGWPILTVTIIGVAIMLSNGQSAGYKRWIIGSFFALASLVTLWRGYTWAAPQPAPDTPAAVLETPTDDSLFFDDYDIPPEATRFVAFIPQADDKIALTLEFPEVRAAGREAVITQASVTLACDCDARQARYTTEALGPDPERDTPREATTPRLRLEVPAADLTAREWHQLRVEGELAYTISRNEVVTEPVTREVRLYVGTPADKTFRINRNRWEVVQEAMVEFPTPVGLSIISVFFGTLAGWGVVAKRTWPATGVPQADLAEELMTDPYDPEEMVSAADLPPFGVRVVSIKKGSEWELAGVHPGDILVRVGEVNIRRRRDIHRALYTHHQHEEVVVSLWRQGGPLDVVLYPGR